VLASLSDSYFKLKIISVSISRPFLIPSHFLLTISTTDYCLLGNISNFGLRRPFHSRQGLKNTCCSSGYKRTNCIELIIKIV